MTISRIAPPAAASDPEQILGLLQGLAQEAAVSLKSFSARLQPDAPPIDLPTLARELGDLFSLVVDLAQHTAEAHTEHYEWGSGIEDDLERLSEGDDSRLTPGDAARLKATILALTQHLRPSDDLVEAVRARAMDAVAFIDEVTIVDEDDEDDDDANPESETVPEN